MFVTRNVWLKYQNPNNGEGNDLGGEGGEGGEGDAGSKGEKPPKISDTEAQLLKEVMAKKAALKEANSALEAATSRLKEFDGLDPKEIKALLQAKKDAETKQLEAKGEWDRLKAQMAEEHTRDRATLEGKLTEVQSENQKLLKQIAELTVGSAFSQSKFIAEEMALTPAKARVVYGTHFETVDGQVVAYDKPAGSATRTMLVDAQGEPLGFEAALRKIVDADPERDQVLRSKRRQGAGSNTSPKAGAPADIDTSKLVGKDKIALALEKAGLV